MIRPCLILSVLALGFSADESGCLVDPSGLQKCQGDMAIADATTMLQKTQMQVKGIRSTDSATCSSVTDAVWAAMDSYKKEQLGYPANIVAMYFPWAATVREDLASAFWKQEARWPVTNETTPQKIKDANVMMNDVDYAGLWVKDGSCLMAFRGSDSQIDVGMLGAAAPDGYQQYGTKPGAPNGVQWSDVDFHGLQVHLGIKVELEALLGKMQSDGGLAKIKTTCTNGLILTGHSLGGGTSQLMATLLNKNGDPLGAGLTVDQLYGFGPMPFVKNAAAANDKSSDGCFAGGMYANAVGKNSDGLPQVDLVWQMLTSEALNFKHVKTAHHIMFSPTEEMVTACGEEPPYPYTGKTVKKLPMMDAHSEALYIANVGC